MADNDSSQNTGDVMGGYEWMMSQMQQLFRLMDNDEFMSQLLGYATQGGTPATAAPTEDEAMQAIWDNRSDIKQVYDQMWGEGEYEPEEAVAHWLATTPEAFAQTSRNAVDYALSQGWVQPASEGKEGTKVKTLAREEFESNQAYQNALLLQAAGAQEEQIRQFNVQHELDADRFNLEKLLGEANIELGKAEIALKEKLGLKELDIKQQLGMGDLEQRAQELAQNTMIAEKEIALKEKLGMGELGLGQQQLGLGYLDLLGSMRGPRDWMQYGRVQEAAGGMPLMGWAQDLINGVRGGSFGAIGGQQQMTVQDLLGGQQPSTGLPGTSTGGPGTQIIPGVGTPSSGLVPFAGRQPWTAEQQAWSQAEYRRRAAAAAANGQGILAESPDPFTTPGSPWFQGGGLNTQPGPSSNIIPGVPNPNALPAGVNQVSMPGYNYNKYPHTANEGQATTFAASGGLPGVSGSSQQAVANWMQPLMQGHNVRIDQWNNLDPSAQQMLLGAVESQGGWADDWLNQLAKSAPTGQGQGTSFWGGW